MTFHSSVILFLVAVSTACAPVRQQQPEELAVPPQRSTHTGYSLIPLNEKGWLVASKQQPHNLILVKSGGDPDESYAIRAFTVVLPDFKSSDEFAGFAKSVVAEVDPTRFKKMTQESRTVIVGGQVCENIKDMEEDLGAKRRSNRTDPMIIELYLLVCPHPNKKIAIVVGYSHRYYSGHADPESAQKAEAIFETVEFKDY